MTRLIEGMKQLPLRGLGQVGPQARRDVNWWLKYLPTFSGVSTIWLYEVEEPGTTIATDSSLTGAGGTCGNEFFHYKFGEEILQKTSHISQLEALAVVIALTK